MSQLPWEQQRWASPLFSTCAVLRFDARHELDKVWTLHMVLPFAASVVCNIWIHYEVKILGKPLGYGEKILTFTEGCKA